MRAGLTIVLLLACAAPAWAGSPPPITRPASAPGTSDLESGRQLFAPNCAGCHGTLGQGVQGKGPPLGDAGALAADFYLSTGYMPLGDPRDQPVRRRPPFEAREIRALTAYVASLGHGPPVPDPDPARGDVSDGMHLFASHCAGCHQIVGEGGVVTGAKAPPLDDATPRQIAEAVRVGPYVMPQFSARAISDSELDSIVGYVLYARRPRDAGGWDLDHLGPFSEGLVTWGIAVVALLALCVLIGERRRA